MKVSTLPAVSSISESDKFLIQTQAGKTSLAPASLISALSGGGPSFSSKILSIDDLGGHGFSVLSKSYTSGICYWSGFTMGEDSVGILHMYGPECFTKYSITSTADYANTGMLVCIKRNNGGVTVSNVKRNHSFVANNYADPMNMFDYSANTDNVYGVLVAFWYAVLKY